MLGVITVFFAFHAVKVQMYSQFADLLPQAHPYIKAYNHFRTTFGGANIVSLSLRVKNGDIFNPDTLKKIRYVTEKVDQIDGVNHYQVASLSHVKIRRLEARSGGLIKSVPVLPEQVPTDPAELKELKKAMYNNDIVYGKYLSTDGKAALILAGFNEERLDYGNIQKQIMDIRKHVEDSNTVLYAAGEPMLKGWVWFYTGELAEIFAVTFIFIFGTLIIYFRRLYGVLLPFIGAVAQAIWGLGFLGILGYNLDPLVLVIPLLVSARAASHGVQMVERYFEELEATGDKHHAVAIAMGELLLPGGIGVLADAAGILVLAVATIPLVRKLAFFASFWGFSNIFTILLPDPAVLDVLPRPSKTTSLRSAVDARFAGLGGRILHQSERPLGGLYDLGCHRGRRRLRGQFGAGRRNRSRIAAAVPEFGLQCFRRARSTRTSPAPTSWSSTCKALKMTR